MQDRNVLLASLSRLHKAAWNKGSDDGGVFAEHHVTRDSGADAADTASPESAVTVIRWATDEHGRQPFLAGFYDLNAVLVRKEYEHVLGEIIKCASADDGVDMKFDPGLHAKVPNPFRYKLPEFNMAGVSICGAPGIGKSTFLIYVLVLRLLAGKPTVFRGGLESGFLFDEDGVSVVPKSCFWTEQQPEGTWFLVDSIPDMNSVGEEMIGAVRISKGFIIHSACSRDERCFAWHYRIGRRIPEKIYMLPWTVEELIAGRGLQLGNIRPTERQIEQFCAKFGTSARAVYGNARNPSGYEKHLVERLGFGPVKVLGEARVGAIDVIKYRSNLYLFDVPAPDDRTQCLRMVPSEYVSKLIRDKLVEFREVTPGDVSRCSSANAFIGIRVGDTEQLKLKVW